MTDHAETKTEVVYKTEDGTLTISMLESINFEFKTDLTCAEYSKKVNYSAFLPIAPECVEAFIQSVIEEKAIQITRPSGGYIKDGFIQVRIPIEMGKMSKTVEVHLDLSEGETPELNRDQAMKVMGHRLADLETELSSISVNMAMQAESYDAKIAAMKADFDRLLNAVAQLSIPAPAAAAAPVALEAAPQ